MLKNEVAHNYFEIDRLERAHQYDLNAANDTQIRRRMQKLFGFEVRQFQLKMVKI